MDFKFPPFHENYHMPQITFIDILVDINIFFLIKTNCVELKK